MSERTAEEKLREELEGSLSTQPKSPKSDTAKKSAGRAAKPVRVRSASKRVEKPENVGKRLDPFIEDFERRIAESLNGGKTFSSKHEKPRESRVTSSVVSEPVIEQLQKLLEPSSAVPSPRNTKHEASSEPHIKRELESVSEIGAEAIAGQPESLAELESLSVVEPISEQSESATPADTSQPLPESVPDGAPISEPTEQAHELTESVPDGEPLNESTEQVHELTESVPDVAPVSESTEQVHELTESVPDVAPVSESTEQTHELTESATPAETSQPLPESVPDVAPVDELTESAAPAEAQQDLSDISDQQNFTEDTQDEDSSDEIPVELVDQNDEEIDEEFPNIPVLEAEELGSPSDSIDNEIPDIPVISPDDDEHEQDITDLDEIDDDIDEFSEEPEKDNSADFSPFADVVINVDSDLPQAAPPQPAVDPESEAAPVSVTMPESTKTAEDKLMADIAEAMTGSPLTLNAPDASEPYKLPDNFFAAQDNTNTPPQSAEEKLIANISQALSESPIDIAQENANQNFEEDINPFDEMPLPDMTPTPDFDENYDEEGQDDFDQPFLPDFPSEETEQIADSEEEQPEPETPQDIDEDTDPEELNDPFTIPDFGMNDEEDSSESHEVPMLDDEPETASLPEPKPEPEPEPQPEPEPEPLTAEDRLAQELADFTAQETPEPEPEPEPEPVTLEKDPDPEQQEEESLLSDALPETEAFTDDDNFMASLGDAVAFGSDDEDEPEPAPPAPEPETAQDIPAPEAAPVMSFAAPKAADNFTAEIPDEDSPTIWDKITRVLLGLLLAVGIMMLLQLHSLTDSVTAATLYGAAPTAQSYDYAIDKVADTDITSHMALRGIEGWKLVGYQRNSETATGRYGYELIFMRATPGNL